MSNPNNEKIRFTDKIGLLVVDDNKNIVRLVEQILLPHDYFIIGTTDPIKAIELFKENIEKIDLLIADIVMPVLRGPELADKLLKLKPDLKVLFITGFVIDRDQIASSLTENQEILDKPFNLDALIQKIKHLIK